MVRRGGGDVGRVSCDARPKARTLPPLRVACTLASRRPSPIRPLAVAPATDKALLAPELAAGIRLCEAPAKRLGCGLRRIRSRGACDGSHERWDGRWCIVDGARPPARAAHRERPTARAPPAPVARAWSPRRADEGPGPVQRPVAHRVAHPRGGGRGGQRAAGARLAAGIRLREPPAMLPVYRAHRSAAAARAMGRVERRDGRRCVVEEARPRRGRRVARGLPLAPAGSSSVPLAVHGGPCLEQRLLAESRHRPTSKDTR